MMNSSFNDIFDLPALAPELLDHAPELFNAFRGYANVVECTAQEVLSPRLHALARLAVALAVPSPELARHCLRDAKALASHAEIAGAVNAAALLRSGAAIAHGRLVFKLMEAPEGHEAQSTGRAQMARDREYMTQLRKASPAAFDAMARMTLTRQKSTAISGLDYELIAIAIATVTQCVYCLEVHGNKAKELGASEQQIAAAVHVAITARYEATLHAAGALMAE